MMAPCRFECEGRGRLRRNDAACPFTFGPYPSACHCRRRDMDVAYSFLATPHRTTVATDRPPRAYADLGKESMSMPGSMVLQSGAALALRQSAIPALRK